jgi:predicted Ser/Thr protein kinase
VGTPQVDETDSLASFADMSINDRYVIEAVLGRGGMGTVYLARDLTLDREVALKLHRATGDDAVGRSARLHREAMAMAKLAHPNVVTVFEVATVEDRLYVAMEYVKGETLRGWLAAQPRTWRAIVAMLLETGQGLAAAHAAGLVHRDFKPENVLVGDDGRPRVGDFGLARVGAAPPSVRLPRSIDADVRPDGPTALAVPSTTAVGTPPRVPRHESPALGAPMTQTGRTLRSVRVLRGRVGVSVRQASVHGRDAGRARGRDPHAQAAATGANRSADARA